MPRTISKTAIFACFIGLMLVCVPLLFAAGNHPGQHHDAAPQQSKGEQHGVNKSNQTSTSTASDTPSGHTMHGQHHQHDTWVAPPPEYANKRSTRWADPEAIVRGEKLFQTYCQVCHGVAGTGTGPAAASLAHAPADLTHHFHHAPGDGDAYLFWRISEGGTVEPFKSMQSAMPAFKTILTEDQRWDVLAYVHTYFHLGLAAWHPEKNGGSPSTNGARSTVAGEGKVIALVPNAQQIVVEHGDIKGFMTAMTMGYKVNHTALLEGLKAGDSIRFTIDTQRKTITTIEKLTP